MRPRALLGQGQALERPPRRVSACSLPPRPVEILAAEEEVAQSLLDAKERAHQGGAELQQLEAELRKAGEEDTRLKASLLYPSLRARTAGPRAHRRGACLVVLGTQLGALGPRRPPFQSEVTLTACFTQLTRELEELKETEASLERQEREVDEDTTVTIPSAV